MNPLIEARAAGTKGRGVFARRDLRRGMLLERVPAISLSLADTEAIAVTVLEDFYFANPTDRDGGLLVLGLASLVNHSDTPNAETRAWYDARHGWWVEMRTTREMATGEEITRRYSCPLWFHDS